MLVLSLSFQSILLLNIVVWNFIAKKIIWMPKFIGIDYVIHIKMLIMKLHFRVTSNFTDFAIGRKFFLQ